MEIPARLAARILTCRKHDDLERARIQDEIRDLYKRWVVTVDSRQDWTKPKVIFEERGFVLEDVNGGGDLHRFRIEPGRGGFFVTDVREPYWVHPRVSRGLQPEDPVIISRCGAESTPFRWGLICPDDQGEEALLALGNNRVLLIDWAEARGWKIHERSVVK